MSLLRIPVLLAALSFASPAPAAMVMTLGDALLSRPLNAEGSAAAQATHDYFDADALLTLGAMALAGGALAAAALRLRETPRPAPVRAALRKVAALRPRDAA